MFIISEICTFRNTDNFFYMKQKPEVSEANHQKDLKLYYTKSLPLWGQLQL